jgi:rod shape-determining protein MreC
LHELFKNKAFIITAVTVLLVIIMGVSSTFSSVLSNIGNILDVPLKPVQSLLSYLGQKFDALVSFFRDTTTIRLENERLKKEISELEEENRRLKAYEEKNRELREALNLKERFADYRLVGANVIAKDPGNWFVIFKIDVGRKDGVMLNDPVLSYENGLVGRIMHVNYTSSKVLAIIDEDSVVDGWISSGRGKGGSVIVRGDLQLRDDGLCIMDYITPDIEVQVGDEVATSGLGGVYPKGIIIGTVKEVINPGDDFKRRAIIEPLVNFKNMQEVFVLTQWTGDSDSYED